MEFTKSGLSLKSPKHFMKSMASITETGSLILNLYRYFRAVTMGLPHRNFELDKLVNVEESQEEREIFLKPHKEKYTILYRRRLLDIIKYCRNNDMEPVFITQPALYGNAVDDVTGIDLGNRGFTNISGSLLWKRLELYNDVTRKLGEDENAIIIDLAAELKKSSRYYYDYVHFTAEGADEIGRILAKTMCPYLRKKYKEYYIGKETKCLFKDRVL